MFKPASYETTVRPDALSENRPFTSWVPPSGEGEPKTYREQYLPSYEKKTPKNHYNADMGEPKLWHNSFIRAYDKCEIPGCTVAITDYGEGKLRSKKFEMFANHRDTFDLFGTQFEKYSRESQDEDGIMNKQASNLTSQSIRSDISQKVGGGSKAGSSESLVVQSEMEAEAETRSDLSATYLQESFEKHIADTLDSLSAHLEDKPTNEDNIRWISLIGLESEAIKLLVNKLQLNEIAVDYLFTSFSVRYGSFGNQMFTDIPCMALQDSLEPEYFVKKTWFHGDELMVNKMKSLYQMAMTTSNKTYTLSDLLGFYPRMAVPSMLLHYTKDPRFYKRELAKLEVKSPLYSQGLVVTSGKIGMIWVDKNTVLTYFDLLGEEIEDSIMRDLSQPSYNPMFQDPGYLIYSIFLRNMQAYNRVVDAFDDIVVQLRIDITLNPSIENSKQLYALVNELSAVETSAERFLSVLQGFTRDSLTDNLMSQKSKALFKSLQNQIELTITDINNRINECENLNNLTFNSLSYQTNDSMSKLTLITMIFAPLSFWCGYYGMNFQPFKAVDHNGVGYFWYMASPFTAGFMLLIMSNKLLKLSMELTENIVISKDYFVSISSGVKKKIRFGKTKEVPSTAKKANTKNEPLAV